MDEIFKATPLNTVQFISIFSYLNALSDFLFIENYLPEDDQTKQIPIVNGLYQYFEDHRNNQSMQLKLIRSLLKGSDLYGEEDNENLDVVFVNAMFDHIISSLVFDNFENIYGFIAEVVRRADNYQIDSICKEIKSTLKSMKFENEYGDPSSLTSTAADRIFNDIILPLFPQPKTNLSLFSLDYIYAQAGSIILRFGRINTTYYTDNKTENIAILDEEHLFDEYLISGQILNYLLATTNRDSLTLKAFALPAICYYVFKNKHLLGFENIKYVVTDPIYFQEAYGNLLTYIDETLDSIYNQLMMDYSYNMHVAFSKFYSGINRCSKYIEEFEKSRLECNLLSDWYKRKITDIGETYKNYDLKAVQDSFGESLMQSLRVSQVVMYLIVPHDEENIFNKTKPLSYDLLEFHFPLNNTIEYYALMRENYTVTVIKEADNFTLFKQKLGSSFDELIAHGFPKILKFANQSMDVFLANLIEYKKKRLQSYLKVFDKKQTSNVKWWTEFGLSLIPTYQNISDSPIKKNYTTEILDEINIILFLDKFGESIFSQLIQENTRSLLTSKGTTFRSVLVWILNNKISEKIIKQENMNSEQVKTSMNSILEKLSFHNEVPGFGVTILSEEYLSLLESIIDALKEMINYSFISVKNMLFNIQILKLDSYRTAGILKNKMSRPFFVKTQNITSDTGYGYKFIFIAKNTTAQLRTGYELKEKILVSLNGTAETDEKIYVRVNDVSFEREHNNYVFEINNQLRKDDTRLLFSKIPIHTDQPKIDLSTFDGRFKISSIYNKKERHIIEKGISIDDIVKNYNDQKARYSVTFDDYYAIRNFATTGFTRITGDTNEAKYMKKALYQLAITQSNDPVGEFYLRLFKIESKPIDIINRTLSNIGKTFNLTRFTLTSVSRFSAIKLATMAAPGFKNILYEMTFSKPYFRGQILQIYNSSDLKAILLPGSQFEITNVTETQIEELGDCLKVELQFKHKGKEEYARYRKMLNEISRIKF